MFRVKRVQLAFTEYVRQIYNNNNIWKSIIQQTSVGLAQARPNHPNVSCIQRQNPSFVDSEIQVPADLELLPLHEKYLEDHFGWRSTTF